MGMHWIVWIFSYNNQKARFFPLICCWWMFWKISSINSKLTSPPRSLRNGQVWHKSFRLTVWHSFLHLVGWGLLMLDIMFFVKPHAHPNRKQLNLLTYLLENRFFARPDQTLWRRFCRWIATCFDFWHLHKEEFYMFRPPLCTESPSLPPPLLVGTNEPICLCYTCACGAQKSSFWIWC